MDINLTCPINTLGYGYTGLNIALAMDRLGHKVAWWPIGGVEADEKYHPALQTMRGRTHFYNRHAPSLRIYHQFDLAQHVGDNVHCALPIFELNRFFPNEIHHLKNQDIVFVASHWAGVVLAENGVPYDRIAYAPFGVDQSIFHPRPKGNGSPTVFFNCGKWEVRKGHDILVEAFNKAFGPNDNVELWMVCQNPVVPEPKRERYNAEWNQLYMGSKLGRAGKIQLLPRQKSQKDIADLMAAVDCGVFPARGEGWNLELAEMMAMGKHVIATNYAAHTEFCNPSNARLISIDKLEDAHDDTWFFANHPGWQGRPGQWAALEEGQVDQLVHHMREVHRLNQEGKLTENTRGIETFQHFTWENCAREIVLVLEQWPCA